MLVRRATSRRLRVSLPLGFEGPFGASRSTYYGHGAYLRAVDQVFRTEIDYAQLQKIYGAAPEGPQVRYSPAICMGARKAVINGKPEHKHISTSYVERQNLTIRMSMRRFTRLINGFSKKVENHEHALALYFMYYDFCRIHQTLRVTPAMEAGVADHLWSIEEIIDLLAPKKETPNQLPG